MQFRIKSCSPGFHYLQPANVLLLAYSFRYLTEQMQVCWLTVLTQIRKEVLHMHNEYSLKEKTSDPTFLRPWLFVYCLSVIRVLLLP
jgi:hypothetical protein